MSYVDEGHVLHHVNYLLAHRTWEPDTYSYPTFPFYLIAGTALAWSPVYALTHGHPLLDDLSPAPPEYYDILEPAGPDPPRPPGHAGVLARRRRPHRPPRPAPRRPRGGPLRRLAGGPGPGPGAAQLDRQHQSARGLLHPRRAPLRREGPDGRAAAARRGAGGADGRPGRRHQVSGGPGLPPRRPGDPARAGDLAGAAPPSGPRGRRRDRWPCSSPCRPLALRTATVLHSLREMDSIYGIQEIGSYWRPGGPPGGMGPADVPPRDGDRLPPADRGGARRGPAGPPLVGHGRGMAPLRRATGAAGGPLPLPGVPQPARARPPGLRRSPPCSTPGSARGSPAAPWLDLAAAALPVLLFAPALYQYDAFQIALEDSREKAVRWLAGQVRPNDRVLFLRELAFSAGAARRVAGQDPGPALGEGPEPGGRAAGPLPRPGRAAASGRRRQDPPGDPAVDPRQLPDRRALRLDRHQPRAQHLPGERADDLRAETEPPEELP